MPARVLVVEDDPAIRHPLAAFLTDAGYAPVQADSGEEALALVDQDRPDVILLDLALPGMDGWEFLRRLRAAPGGARTPVLVLSGTRRPEWDPANVSGVLAYLPKPFAPSDVLAEVQFLLEYAQGRPGNAV